MAMQSWSRRYLYLELLIVCPVFLFLGTTFAISLIPKPNARVAGFVFAGITLVVLIGALSSYFVATLRSDGSLTFTGILRSTTTNVADVRRVYVRSSGRTGSWVIESRDSSVKFGMIQGAKLARAVVQLNPSVAYPDRLFRGTRWPG